MKLVSKQAIKHTDVQCSANKLHKCELKRNSRHCKVDCCVILSEPIQNFVFIYLR